MPRPKKNSIKGSLLVPALRKKFRCRNNNQLTKFLGYSQPQIGNIENRTSNTVTNISQIAYKAYKCGESTAVIKPIVEFYAIEKGTRRKNSLTFSFLSDKSEDIKNLLDTSYGIYIFFDSGGKPIYVGKAVNQTIAKRAKQSYNANLYRQIFKSKRIRRTAHVRPSWTYVRVHDVADFFSAYKIKSDSIGHIEALLTRCMINTTWNRRVEGFAT